MIYEEIETNQGGVYLNVNKFKFIFKSRSNFKDYYQCNEKKCKIIICKDLETGFISHDSITESRSSPYPRHNHSDHLDLIVNAKVIAFAKNEIFKNPASDLRTVYSSASNKFLENKSLIKPFKQVQSTLQKFKASLLPQQPSTRAGLNEIDYRFTSTTEDQPFLLSNDGKC